MVRLLVEWGLQSGRIHLSWEQGASQLPLEDCLLCHPWVPWRHWVVFQRLRLSAFHWKLGMRGALVLKPSYLRLRQWLDLRRSQ